MKNPFESGHIKNYLLLYASVVVIMILFFIASTLFHDVQEVNIKTWSESDESTKVNRLEESGTKKPEQTNSFKLLEVNSTSYSGYNDN